MRIPVIRGVIDRRLLVNFRVDVQVLADLLPPPFRPKPVAGYGIAGICLIRLKHVRPPWVPQALGFRSENAAHRIAVMWEDEGGVHEGVYIPRRDTSSLLNTLAGGRVFPGVHHHARFRSEERHGGYSVVMESVDGRAYVDVAGRVTDALPDGSVFTSSDEASTFFKSGSIGYSATSHANRFDGLELRTFAWRVEPLAMERVKSSYFDNRDCFPEGSVSFDSAWLMRNVRHEWHERETLAS